MYGVAVDTETTGLEAGVHEIVSICLIIHDENFNEVSRFTSTIRPMHPILIEDDALQVNGFTRKEVKDFPTPMEVKNNLLEWFEPFRGDKGLIPLGHNFSFDKGFLQIFFGDFYNDLFYYKFRDTFCVAQALKDAGLIDPPSLSLVKLTEHFGIPHIEHDAFSDTWATLKLYQKLINIIKESR